LYSYYESNFYIIKIYIQNKKMEIQFWREENIITNETFMRKVSFALLKNSICIKDDIG